MTDTAAGHNQARARLGARLAALAADIKLSHTLFAMPWAILSTVMAARMSGGRYIGKLALVVACMVTARTFAMAANRLFDASLDARNPRTAGRAIPSGRLSRGFVAAAMILTALLFIAASAGFWWAYNNRWPAVLSLPVLAYLAGYPFTKRFSHLCHYYLGGALALAPLCAWLAVAGHIGAPPLWMAGAVLLWTAGFDIIYACQDYAADLAMGLFSIPAKLGIGPALWVARLSHAGSLAMMVGLSRSTALMGTPFMAAVAVAAILLVIEHALVRPNDLSKVGLAFFTINGIISLMLGTVGVVEVITKTK